MVIAVKKIKIKNIQLDLEVGEGNYLKSIKSDVLSIFHLFLLLFVPNTAHWIGNNDASMISGQNFKQ